MVKHKKVSKHYDHGCLQNFLLHFMFLLTVTTVKKSNIFGGTYFTFLKEGPRANSSLVKPNVGLKEKIEKVVIM